MASHGSSFQKTFMGAAGSGGAGLDITDVFSTYLYDGNGSTQTITNNIDLANEGGLVWIKQRSSSESHTLVDTVRGAKYVIDSSLEDAQILNDDTLTGFNSNGFAIGDDHQTNENNTTYVSWAFRKAPKFFDVVTYTGSGSAKTVAHSLGSAPGMIIIKNTGVADPWAVYHRANTAAPQTDYLVLNESDATVDSAAWWNDTAPTSSVFTVGTDHSVNANGENYVAYLFAHNNGDGGFGPDGDADIIKCGSFTANDSGEVEIDVGFEPQWILTKSTASSGWFVFDAMRAMSHTNTNALVPSNSNAEGSLTTGYVKPTTTGWIDSFYGNTPEIIYMAIRRGPLAPPTAGTEVFAVTTQSGSTPPAHDTGFVTDFSVRRPDALSSISVIYAVDRLRGRAYLDTGGTNSETNNNSNTWDFMDGWYGSTSNDSNKYAWSWKRAPKYFDVVAYSGNDSASSPRAIKHSLGSIPELYICKSRSQGHWFVYHAALGSSNVVYLNLSTAAQSGNHWGNTDPTAENFYVQSSETNDLTNFIAYLFATLAGVSKVGSVTHSGTTNVDCGFSSGARFVMLKRTDASGDWYIWDSTRGIVSGNDPYLMLNSTAAEVTNTDYIDPLSSGFTISDAFTDGDYIFYAIA